ncbi:MAG: CU044_5270 family protein [Microbacteriaceae bacterium]|nr:CU044_5270 family protein [Microbacteriaceae bacterium]MCL2793827.1 CU044_5270 family protein [Microbacteriaceae bacterium]
MTIHIDSPALPDEAEFERLRVDILARIDAESLAAASAHVPSRKRPRSRGRVGWRRAGWSAGGAALALAVAGVLVAVNVIGLPGSRVGASPAAAAVLYSAADVASHESDPSVALGQYLKIQMGDITQYIPADRSKTWIEVRPNGVQTSSGLATWWLPGVGGDYFGTPSSENDAELVKLPTDPSRLLSYIYAQTRGAGHSRNGEAFVWIADRLSTGTVPASVRAVMFRTAALIPGVVISDHSATVGGRTGVAVSYTEQVTQTRQELVIDPATGAFIGERDVRVLPLIGTPTGTVDSFAVTTTVVDTAPRATKDGGFDSTGCKPDMWSTSTPGMQTSIDPGKNGKPVAYECPSK